MWNSTNSSVKFLDLIDTVLPKDLFFDCNLATSSSQIQGKGFSKLDNEFTVPFLNDKIGINLTTNVEQSMPCHRPFIAISFKKFISGFFKRCGTSPFKRFLKPMKKSNIGVRNFQNTSIMAIFITIIRFVFQLASMKASFTIDNSSKISKINRIVNFGFIKNSMFMVSVIELNIPLGVTGSPNSMHMKSV